MIGSCAGLGVRIPAAAAIASTASTAATTNAWCTPHSSAWTHQLPRRRYAVIAENVNRLVAGEPLRNVVRAAHLQGL